MCLICINGIILSTIIISIPTSCFFFLLNIITSDTRPLVIYINMVFILISAFQLIK